MVVLSKCWHGAGDGSRLGDGIFRIMIFLFLLSSICAALGGAKQILWYTWSIASWLQRLFMFLLLILGMKKKAAPNVKELMSKKGLAGYNEAMLSFAGPQVAKALQIIALRCHKPLLLHCSLGKDRTGECDVQTPQVLPKSHPIPIPLPSPSPFLPPFPIYWLVHRIDCGTGAPHLQCPAGTYHSRLL